MQRCIAYATASAAFALRLGCTSGGRGSGEAEYRQVLGEDNPKIKREGAETYVFADGDAKNPRAPGTEWFDFTGRR